MFFMKEKDQERKRASRIDRPWSYADRTPLALLSPGIKTVGIVISLTSFGAYVDIGTDVDGLLHVSQISHGEFVSHPRQKLSPGQEVTVTIRRLSAELKKLHLTMLPDEILQEEKELQEVGDRIPLDELQVDDELWGELKRVTDFGAFVEIGCVVDGFLHFMDHPEWADSQHPSAFMKRGDRVRIWVLDVDRELNRVKLTAVRPDKLPGPRRDAIFL
jgi:small subunit ribosomal protein S1